MEIKLITTDVTTSGGGVKFRFLGNVEIKKGPTIFGTTTKPKQTVGFKFNNVETTVDSNDDGYFEVYRDSDEPITQFSTGTNNNLLKTFNVSNLDTSQVTNMSNMFYACMGLTSLDLSNFDTSKVTNMSDMFGGCMGLTSLDLSNWNISKVRDIGSMFKGCASLRTIKINNEASANKLIAQIQTDLSKTATWNTETKKITIPE